MAVLVDIDGTLADVTHRRRHLEQQPKNWKAFNADIHLDPPHNNVCKLVRHLGRLNAIVLCSGREECYREQTLGWLKDHAILFDALYMRSLKDYRSDEVVKSELLDQILADGYTPWLVLDDRSRVVDMWRARGLTCLQVAPGDF